MNWKNKEEQRAYNRTYYAKNHLRFGPRKNMLRQKLRKSRRLYIWEYLKGKVCLDCGENNRVVFEFDHREDKFGDIGNMVSYRVEKIKEEIEKCDIVCANCHRVRTAQKQGWYEGKF